MTVQEMFESVSDEEFLRFERVEDKRSTRPDIHAFLLLNDLFPCTTSIVSGAQHDQIWLGVHESEVSTLTIQNVIELSRCGVSYDDETGSLYMFA